MPVRVLFVNDTARNGGPGRSLHAILKFLDPARVHRAVLLPREGVISDLYRQSGVADELLFERNLVENPVEPRGRPMERADFDAPLAVRAARLAVNVGRGALAVRRVGELVRRGRYDLVYCNGTNADFLGGALAGGGARVLWHVRYTAVPPALAPLHRRLAARPGVRRIVCVSRASAALFPHVPHKVRVVHNALDVDAFAPDAAAGDARAELGFAREAVVFGSHGRILPRKGYVEMLRAAALARGRMTDDERARARFVVVGDTPEDMRPDHLAECRALALELGIADVFRFVGFRADVRPYVAAYDVGVVPSVYPDPLPRAVLEAMAFAKPVVAFDVGGVGEMIEDGRTGALVRGAPPDVEGLADAMLVYLRDPGRRGRDGADARARVLARFDGRAHGRAIEAEILAAVAGHGAEVAA